MSTAAGDTVAALYVETGGAYFGLEGVEPWDEKRDARLYAGPWPVVAHPPCQKWCQLAPLNASRLPDYEIGDDGGCFAAALEAVRTYGGVLEHPAYSIAWHTFALPRPITHGWQRALTDEGWSTEIAQVAYGHGARKRTWLYYVGDVPPPALDWREPPATMQVSAFGMTDGRSRFTYAEALDKGKSNATPASFRDALIAMARESRSPATHASPRPSLQECRRSPLVAQGHQSHRAQPYAEPPLT